MGIYVRQYRGLIGFALLGAAGAFTTAGCSDAFTSCYETHTCPRGGTGANEGGAEVGGAGEGAVAGSDESGAGAVGGSVAIGAVGRIAAVDGGSARAVGCGKGMRCAPPVPEGWDGPFSTDLTGAAPAVVAKASPVGEVTAAGTISICCEP